MDAPWRLLFGSVAGSSHERRGDPCQDYCHAVVVAGADGPVVVAACADGAGSAPRSEVGARRACLAFVRLAAEAVRSRPTDEAIAEAMVRTWYEQARRELGLEACLNAVPLSE